MQSPATSESSAAAFLNIGDASALARPEKTNRQASNVGEKRDDSAFGTVLNQANARSNEPSKNSTVQDAKTAKGTNGRHDTDRQKRGDSVQDLPQRDATLPPPMRTRQSQAPNEELVHGAAEGASVPTHTAPDKQLAAQASGYDSSDTHTKLVEFSPSALAALPQIPTLHLQAIAELGPRANAGPMPLSFTAATVDASTQTATIALGASTTAQALGLHQAARSADPAADVITKFIPTAELGTASTTKVDIDQLLRAQATDPIRIDPARLGQATNTASRSAIGLDRLLPGISPSTNTSAPASSASLISGYAVTNPSGGALFASSYATAAGSAADIPASVGTAAWDGAVGARLVRIAQSGDRVAQLSLAPPHLGELKIQLQVDNEQATVHFTAASAGVREALEQALPRLREMLSESGLELVNVDISQHDSSSADPNSNDADPGHKDANQQSEAQTTHQIPAPRGSDSLIDAFV